MSHYVEAHRSADGNNGEGAEQPNYLDHRPNSALATVRRGIAPEPSDYRAAPFVRHPSRLENSASLNSLIVFQLAAKCVQYSLSSSPPPNRQAQGSRTKRRRRENITSVSRSLVSPLTFRHPFISRKPSSTTNEAAAAAARDRQANQPASQSDKNPPSKSRNEQSPSRSAPQNPVGLLAPRKGPWRKAGGRARKGRVSDACALPGYRRFPIAQLSVAPFVPSYAPAPKPPRGCHSPRFQVVPPVFAFLSVYFAHGGDAQRSWAPRHGRVGVLDRQFAIWKNGGSPPHLGPRNYANGLIMKMD